MSKNFDLEDIGTRLIEGRIDAGHVQELCRRVLKNNLGKAGYYKEVDYRIETSDNSIKVLDSNGIPVAKMKFSFSEKLDYSIRINHVDSSEACQNHSEKMLKNLEGLARKENIDYLCLEVDEASSLVDLYDAHGFRVSDHSEFVSENSNRIYMRKDL